MRYRLTTSRWSALALIVLATFVTGGCGCNNGGGSGSKDALPTPESKDYHEAVIHFFVGSASLKSNDLPHAEEHLKLTTEQAPGEPAGWADWGLVALRQNKFDIAEERLKKAASLAPDNASIQTYLGLLAIKQGKSPEAIAALKKASELAPSDMKVRYALAQEIERQAGPNADEASLREIRQLHTQQPQNLEILTEMARMAAKRGDANALKEATTLLKALSQDWPANVKEQFSALEKAASNPRAAILNVQLFHNTLKASPQWKRDYAAVKFPENQVGEPIERLLTLPNPSPLPALPDTAMTFTVAPLPSVGTGKWQWVGAISLNGEGNPLPITANGKLAQVAGSAPLAFPGGAASKAILPDSVRMLDWNWDFTTDLALAGAGGLKLYQQGAKGAFTDVTQKAKLSASVLSAAYAGAWAADFDLDGDLDMVLATQSGPPVVLRNNGTGTFQEIKLFADVKNLRGFAWGDLDSEGTPDAVLLDAEGKLHIFANERSAHFRAWPVPNSLGKIAAITLGDVNNDGRFDLVALQTDGTLLRLSNKPDSADWEVAEIAKWANAPKDLAPGTAQLFLADLDNNGSVDIVASSPTVSQAWLSDPQSKFAPLAAPLDMRVLAVADMSGKGHLDLIGTNKTGDAVIATSQGAKNYHWLTMRPRANTKAAIKSDSTADSRINTFGIGAFLEVRAGLLVQKQLVQGPLVHFGLGENTVMSVMRIVWPNGNFQSEVEKHSEKPEPITADQSILAEQRLDSSCPWLFAWNGKEMAFLTDFIWRSPVGLKINAQDTAGISQTEDWIKVRADQLAPHDGYYDFRITAELWETHFFDYVALMAVDHPEGTEIYTDERFFLTPEPLAIYVTGKPHPVARATDEQGNDVTEIVRSRDGNYLDTFPLGQYQGIAKDHYVEMEIGDDVPKTGTLYLLANGWIHPTDSSINVAISQGDHDPPRSLSLEVPNGKGGWTVAKSNLGFPEGKNKTIVLNLNGIFKPNTPRKLRLRTNLEIYWDSLEIGVAMPDVKPQIQRLAPQTAELRYRGYSAAHQANRSSPELPDYNTLAATGQRWRDLIGYCTRFGDVRELLAKVDDRYVIMNAGDEMALRFPVPPPPPAGFVRDFVLIGDGWEKDGNYNTAFSKTILPLPYHGQKTYNTPPGNLEDDPVYRRHPQDWQTYHTRYITPEAFQNALRPGN